MSHTPIKRVLMIAYHFPPLAGSSGIQRTLRFTQQLPQFGWEPVVLSISPFAYEEVRQDLIRELPSGLRVERAFGFDIARHGAIRGRYPGFLARPDRWLSWWPVAVWAGLRLHRELHFSAIWSTYPIATAHKIGATLQRLTGLPWIADFRDPMAQEGYPEDPKQWKSFVRIEASAINAARYSVCTTPSAAQTYRARYPRRASNLVVIENGYDEASFVGCAVGPPLAPGKTTLLHSGIVYPSERDPTQLFKALQVLKTQGVISASDFCIRFRAPVATELLEALAADCKVRDLVEILPGIEYKSALNEMLSADGLLILQAANCNEQIPAKLYEYLRSRRPILGLTDTKGDTADALRRAGISTLAPLDDATGIAAGLTEFLAQVKSGTAALPSDDAIRASDRLSRTAELARLLDKAISS